jgi:hypothetical protein
MTWPDFGSRDSMLGHGHVPCGPYPVRMVAPKLGDAPHLMQVKEGSRSQG